MLVVIFMLCKFINVCSFKIVRKLIIFAKETHTPFMTLCTIKIFETIRKPLYYIPGNFFYCT